MKHSLIAFLFTLMMVSACQDPGTSHQANQPLTLEDSIAKLENILFDSEQNKLAKQTATQLVAAYLEYAQQHKDDSIAAEYIFKAADISMNLNRPKKTIQLFDLILTEYPDYRKTPSALFLKAFVYEDQLKDLENAKKYYEQFLILYPNSEFADDAEVSLKNLGKTPEELIREFEQNQR